MHPPSEETRPIASLIPYKNNARTHSDKQTEQIAESIKRFGFTNPILIAEDNSIIAGHGRVAAAKRLGFEHVPVRLVSHLNDAERKAYILADNKLAENAGWDNEILKIELQGLMDLEFDLDIIGFSTAEIDIAFNIDNSNSDGFDPLLDKAIQADQENIVTRKGDVWLLGKHRLVCGDAMDVKCIRSLCADNTMDLMFTDPPYNVPINGHVSGSGKHTHREFEYASGEMNQVEFTKFLNLTLSNGASSLKDGAISYVCMDWRHIEDLLAATKGVFDEFKNLCVWNKTNGGMGSFYRSKHELVFVFKKGKASHTNNFGLGEDGRYRTNVWDYAGINAISSSRDKDLAMHPTVKPVSMISDAIMDCSHRGENILDIFAGSGSTLIAAEQTGRNAYLLELDPIYCDTIIKRFEEITGQKTILEKNGQTFEMLLQSQLNKMEDAEYA